LRPESLTNIFWLVFAGNIISCLHNLFIGWLLLTCLYICSFKNVTALNLFLIFFLFYIKDVTLILLFLEGMTGDNQYMNASSPCPPPPQVEIASTIF